MRIDSSNERLGNSCRGVGRGCAARHNVAAVTEIPPRSDDVTALARLEPVLARYPTRVIACSGGIDSLVLATVAHRAAPTGTTIAHTVTPAVPAAATARVVAYAEREGWMLELVRSSEFDDERYLANPTDRCYFCKTNLYDAIDTVVRDADAPAGTIVLSGANTDDLGDYRPGLAAAREHGVRHPYLEAGVSKHNIRHVARTLGIEHAEMPASPCLASRLYTGTRVTAGRLRAVEVGEAAILELTGVEISRCRVRDDEVLVEVPLEDRILITDGVLESLTTAMRAIYPSLVRVRLDAEPYRSGRAFLRVR